MESCEESGSVGIDFYLNHLKERMGKHIKAVFILDSGAGNYDTLWITSSLRGCAAIKVEIGVTK